MVESFRKQLDALMGANRNGDSIEVKRKYYDRDVCRPFLAGLCPHDLFTLTKMDLGPCPKVHSLQLRKEYNEANADNYERELEDCLEKHLLECERKIQRCLKRLDDEDMSAATAIAVSVVTQSPEVQEFSRQIKLKLKEAENLELEGRMEDKALLMKDVEALRSYRADMQAALLLVAFNKDRSSQPVGNPLAPLPQLPPDANPQDVIKERLKKAEELGEQGMVDEAQKAMEEAEALKKLVPRPDGDHRTLPPDARVADQKLRVCDICGAYLSIYDSDRRLADHFGGKLHLGYMRIREKLAEIRQAKEQRQKAAREKEPDLVDSKPRDRAVSRERDYEREKPAERLRDRDSRHSRDKDRDRYHDRSRDRERDRTYGRDRDRGRRRSRSPSRERVRERSRDLSPRERRDRERH